MTLIITKYKIDGKTPSFSIWMPSNEATLTNTEPHLILTANGSQCMLYIKKTKQVKKQDISATILQVYVDKIIKYIDLNRKELLRIWNLLKHDPNAICSLPDINKY